MFITPLLKTGKRRRRADEEAMPPSVPGLVLVSASYDGYAQQLTLAFDRAVDISSLNLAQFQVSDGIVQYTIMVGSGAAELLAPDTFALAMEAGDPYESPEQLLNATAFTGLKAADDSGTWDGAMDLVLPFPS